MAKDVHRAMVRRVPFFPCGDDEIPTAPGFLDDEITHISHDFAVVPHYFPGFSNVVPTRTRLLSSMFKYPIKHGAFCIGRFGDQRVFCVHARTNWAWCRNSSPLAALAMAIWVVQCYWFVQEETNWFIVTRFCEINKSSTI